MSSGASIRIQTNLVARSERRLLDWICGKLPEWVTPNYLTGVGVIGACIVFSGYILSWVHPAFLWLSVSGFVLHWFGDSLDGSVARYRRIERPKSGYLLDHSVDAFCNFIMMTGLGLTQYIHLSCSLLALSAYFMLCIYVFLNNKVTGVLQLSFLACGPTEIRILLIALTAGMYFIGHQGVYVGQQFLSLYDTFLLGATFISVILFVVNVQERFRALSAEENVAAAKKLR